MEQADAGKQCKLAPPLDAELRALYDIRVKEAHHYNTMVWAFPPAYAALVAAEYRFFGEEYASLMIASIFNFSLWYIFQRHLQHKACILTVLRFTEQKLAERYGVTFVPQFTTSSQRGAPTATDVANWAIMFLTICFFIRAVVGPTTHP